MLNRIRQIAKITVITVTSLLVITALIIAAITSFIFTPEKLTPLVEKAVNQSINAHLRMKSVELTFFSTFPEFSLSIKEGSIVSKTLRDTLFTKRDSLLKFDECRVDINPLTFITQQKIKVRNIALHHPIIYAYRDKKGNNNWEITKPSATTDDTTSIRTPKKEYEITLDNVELLNGFFIFEDNNNQLYAAIDSVNFRMNAMLSKEKGNVAISFDQKNLRLYQQGRTIANGVYTQLNTELQIDRKSLTYRLDKAMLSINGIEFTTNGVVHQDTLRKELNLNLKYQLHTPRVETVLGMIPSFIVKKAKVAATGKVIVSGTVTGKYGNKLLPYITLLVQIKNASAKYEGVKYGIKTLAADFSGAVDLMQKKRSYLHLKLFQLAGKNSSIIADMKADHLFGDPLITGNCKASADLGALAMTFPFDEGIKIGGFLTSNLHLHCRLSSLKRQDIGRIIASGNLNIKNVLLEDKNKGFQFKGSSALNFTGKNNLQAGFSIENVLLSTPKINLSIEQLIGKVHSSNPQNRTQIIKLEYSASLYKMNARQGDSLQLYLGQTSIKGVIQPSKKNMMLPSILSQLTTDSLHIGLKKSTISLKTAFINTTLNKMNDSIWYPHGELEFNRFNINTPNFKLPLRLNRSSIQIDGDRIDLHEASLKIGSSDLIVSGGVSNIYKTMKSNGIVFANLNLRSNYIDINELTQALPNPAEQKKQTPKPTKTKSVAKEAATLFVVPKEIHFTFETSLNKVKFNKSTFEHIEGRMEIKDQNIYLSNLSLKALDANMKATLLYRAKSQKRGLLGCDLKIVDVNITRLVDFMPSLDTIVPMLRSFKGIVDFEITLESQLDSMMNLPTSTIKSAMHIKGDSLVLMDGETFSQIAKMMHFKNKKTNVFDSISVNATVQNGVVTLYPFLVEIDRYKAAIGGKQGLDLSFNYHISVLKSPIPIKLGLNISGTPEKMKFRLGKAKYKNEVTPVALLKIDSTRMNTGAQIKNNFLRFWKNSRIEP